MVHITVSKNLNVDETNRHTHKPSLQILGWDPWEEASATLECVVEQLRTCSDIPAETDHREGGQNVTNFRFAREHDQDVPERKKK